MVFGDLSLLLGAVSLDAFLEFRLSEQQFSALFLFQLQFLSEFLQFLLAFLVSVSIIEVVKLFAMKIDKKINLCCHKRLSDSKISTSLSSESADGASSSSSSDAMWQFRLLFLLLFVFF